MIYFEVGDTFCFTVTWILRKQVINAYTLMSLIIGGGNISVLAEKIVKMAIFRNKLKDFEKV